MSWSFTRLAIAAVFCSLLIADGEAQQMPQRVGAQSFQLLDTLWVDGGRHVDEDGAAMDKVPDFVPVVNQSIVFLNTGTRSGALVALGGFIDSQGALSLADMSTVYIFDIETEQWTAQPVTDVNGQAVDVHDQADGKDFESTKTFPSRRMLACAAAGSSQDKTSHNLVLMGGQNNVIALADAWVLSLPSAAWIRAQTNPEFAPNYPTAESSCLLLNSRFLLMFGGCLLDVNTHKPLIGGNATGFATHSKPKFLNFSSPLLDELFMPPYGVGVFGYGYLSFIMLSTTCLMTLVLLLQWRSQQPDTQFAHWSGGPEADGTWTGEPFTSTFIRAPTLDRPPQGLLSVYYNFSPDGVWSQKNSAQRLSRGAYFAFTYLPMILAVLYGRLWKALDDEVKRIDVYNRLQKKGGALGSRSLCVNYHVFWTPLCILQAVMYGHWSVAVSSVGSVLATIVIPVLANYLFYWELYSGAALDWPDIYSWQVALVDRDWAYILAGTLAAANLCCVVLCFMLPSLETGLSRDVRGLADLVYLLEGSEASDFALPANDADHTASSQSLAVKFVKEIFPKSLHPTITKMGKWLRIIIGAIKVVFNGVSGSSSKFLVFRRLLYLIWLLILFLFMFAQGWITASLNKNAKDTRWNYGIPIDPNVYLIVGILS
ncbi:unnamed protein product [Clonostachys byssicola]|uniref:Uncharacterized protein n=1 Tax=Clonostachys byssicola TaxID=160290 RepID=A0A9N9U9N9_9HYPO|nr:unnamed protein product [Clonostachys byssicola]